MHCSKSAFVAVTFVTALVTTAATTVIIIMLALLSNPDLYTLAGAGLCTIVLVLWSLWAPSLKRHGPDFVPFYGAAIEIMENFETFQDWILAGNHRWSNGFKKNWTASVFGGHAYDHGFVFLVTPSAVRHVLKDSFGCYEKGTRFRDRLFDFLGDGIFTSDGPQWRLHRKVSARMFSTRLLRDGTAVALAQARKLLDKLSASAHEGAKSVDIQDLFFRFTMDTFCSLAFGVDVDSQSCDHSFAQSFDRVQEICNERSVKPWWKVFKVFGIGTEGECTRQCKIMRAFAEKIINSKRRAKLNDQKLGPDLISRFMDSKSDDAQEFTNKELIDIVLNFLLAGRDTTACALTWTVFELLRHPEEMRHIRAEVRTAIKKVGGCSTSALEDLPHELVFNIVSKHLPYTKACVSEAIRLHPPVPVDAKFACKADVLPDGTPVVRGQTAVYCPYAMGRDPTLWPEPLQYRPNRWAKPESGSLHRPNQHVSDFVFPHFNAGPRLCLGRPLAYLETQLMLACIVLKFDMEAVSDLKDESYVQTIVMRKKNGLWVQPQLRRS